MLLHFARVSSESLAERLAQGVGKAGEDLDAMTLAYAICQHLSGFLTGVPLKSTSTRPELLQATPEVSLEANPVCFGCVADDLIER